MKNLLGLIVGTSKNPNSVAILRCSKNFNAYICAIDTLLRSSRLREMAHAVIPAPVAFAHRVMTAHMRRAKIFFAPCLA